MWRLYYFCADKFKKTAVKRHKLKKPDDKAGKSFYTACRFQANGPIAQLVRALDS
ncbi:hypothetical protein RNAN_1959 [Rheinheimera nanhaiensis E407-8]|uniref:Uncharacterized protein n=1 Tax=Rheinheimera nanhaiensis E407-8 TaxID=562729 RepID=I1DY42_9GAMM|nr:hypothetical protein RNAN_1959 [Rheinheimera nanhaiensis E407-8]